MKKKYLCITFFCILLIFTGCTTKYYKLPTFQRVSSEQGTDLVQNYVIPQDPVNYPEGYNLKVISQEERKEDLDALVTGIETRHINPYHNISKENFHIAVDVLKNHLEGMNIDQFYYELTRLVALIGESHSGVTLSNSQDIPYYVFPYGILSFENVWYLGGVSKKYADYIGWKVDKISGFTKDELIRKLSPYISHDTEVWLEAQLMSRIAIWNMLYYAGIITDSSLTLELSKDAEHKAITLSAIALTEFKQEDIAMIEYKKAITYPEDNYYSCRNIGDILFIQYNQCFEDPNQSMKNFVQEVKPLLEKSKYCVVDLRYNSGGNSAILNPLIKELKKYNKTGDRLYTFIGEDTFSSGILNAIDLRQNAKAALIGTATGGSANGYGEVKSFHLPHSGLIVTYCVKFFEPTNLGINPLLPDLQVTHTLEDFINGVDPELQALQNKLNIKN